MSSRSTRRRFRSALLPMIGLAVALYASALLPSCSADARVADGTGDAANDSPSTGSDGGTTTNPQDGPWSFVTLKKEALSTNGVPVTVEYLRADRPDGKHSYLLYQHTVKDVPAPLAIYNEPYAGIDWTGEDVDARWAALGAGGHPDVDAPDYNGTDQIAYAPQKPQDAVDASLVFAFNGFAVIRPYARYYAGGNLEDDALDSAAPYFFARTRPNEIDVTRIGSIGASWGGMMAIFGASHAPSDTPPRAVVAMSAPSDFVDLWQWAKTDLPPVYPKPADAEGFYSPYWRRITPTTGTPPGGEDALPYTHAGLCAPEGRKLPGQFLLPHDTWDLLIPVRQTQELVKSCANAEGLYWPRGPIDYQTAAFDHGPASSEGKLPTMQTFSFTYLIEKLARESTPTLYSVASTPSLVIHLNLILAAQRAGDDVGYIVPRLLELADPRLTVVVAETSAQAPGAKIVADAINEVYKTHFDEAGVRAQLATGLPKPPDPL